MCAYRSSGSPPQIKDRTRLAQLIKQTIKERRNSFSSILLITCPGALGFQPPLTTGGKDRTPYTATLVNQP